MTRRYVASLLSGLLLSGLLLACGGRGDTEADGAALGDTRVPVDLSPVVRDSIVETLDVQGRLAARPGGSALLSAPAAGAVRSIAAQVGDQVRRGEVVVQLEVPDLAADLRQTEAAADLARRQAARQRALLAEGITSARQVEEAEAGARQADAAAAASRALFARAHITSPLTGRVQDIMVQPGERVDAGRPLAQVVAGDTLDLIGAVPASRLGRLRVGLPATVSEDGDSTQVPGWVAGLAPEVDSLTNAGRVVIRVPNPRGRLHPGAGATGRVRLDVHRDALIVPDSAIVVSGDSALVFVVGPDSIAHPHSVVRGVQAGGRTEVRGDLQPGQVVVTTGAFGLEDGMRITSARGAGASR